MKTIELEKDTTVLLSEQKRSIKKILKGARKVIFLVPLMVRLSGCGISFSDYEIKPLAKADFDKDGIEDIVGISGDPAYKEYFNANGRNALIFANGKNIKSLGETRYVDPDSLTVLDKNAEYKGDYSFQHLSTDDINKDGWLDISYNKNIDFVVYINQGNGTFKRR